MNERLQQLYQEVILDHNKNPRNFSEPCQANLYAHGKNPLCGDDFQLFLYVDDNKIIQDLGFTGSGCAISKSSASMMTDMVKGKTVSEAIKLRNAFHKLVTEDIATTEVKQAFGKLKIFEGVKKFPVRVKCATLIWHALEDALQDQRDIDEKQEKSVSTE